LPHSQEVGGGDGGGGTILQFTKGHSLSLSLSLSCHLHEVSPDRGGDDGGGALLSTLITSDGTSSHRDHREGAGVKSPPENTVLSSLWVE